MAVKRASVPAQALPREEIEIADLGGSVIVRGLTLSERLDLFAGAAAAGFTHIPQLLAMCVLADDDKPLFTAEQWEAFGGAHLESTLTIFNVARRLAGLDVEDAKKN